MTDTLYRVVVTVTNAGHFIDLPGRYESPINAAKARDEEVRRGYDARVQKASCFCLANSYEREAERCWASMEAR